MATGTVDWALRLLDVIEREEVRLLSWGLVDGSFTRDELEDLIERHRALAGAPVEVSAEDALDLLTDRKLVLRLEYPQGMIYRSRLAESVRLLARLKQLFIPKHVTGRGWQTAPNLVSDFRIVLRPRMFPERSLLPTEAIRQIAETVRLDAITRAALELLLRTDSPEVMALAQFQVDSARQILANLGSDATSATIVSAGTGSGKTLAFYLPVLASVAAKLSEESWTHVLALYPRNELLKDQLTEALRVTRVLNTGLKELGLRRVRLGTYYGDTPASNTLLGWGDKSRADQAWTCPFLRCPDCDGPLIWGAEERAQGIECLRCLKGTCGAVVGADEFSITRGSVQSHPPDVLFTTTEMLNQHLNDSWSAHLFGVGKRARWKPRVMLLDEVHTYEGTSGAQVAYLLRRWRNAVGRPVQFVGLSATLRNAASFFAQLTGVSEHLVSAIEPSAQDTVGGGMEYLLALRGDPVSGAGLLSTTIQTAMCMRRCLDPASSPSRGVFGSRLFLFTDDLDVTNRLYNDTLDAEGLTRFGAPTNRAPLASLRSPARPDRIVRLLAGQSWDASEEIGFDLQSFRARVGRTSSQDKGVDLTSDIIVATAALEVGFNAPDVGGVIQHKAPRDAAQFLQRKGRAGRTREMRPWTVVVLSDFGRDRLAYQGYDLLFDPELEARTLPLGNRYVMKIQATCGLMDWLAGELRDVPNGSVWADLSGPERNPNTAPYTQQRQDRERRLLRQLLIEPDSLERFRKFLTVALQLDEDAVQGLLWDAPRALVTAVIPTLERRLATGWQSGVPGTSTEYTASHPIPDFVPATLFSDLSLPEVEVSVPMVGAAGQFDAYPMPIVQALREFAPGRVTYRFGIRSSNARHWVAPATLNDQSEQQLDIRSFVSRFEELGIFHYVDPAGKVVPVRCVRPWALETAVPPEWVADSSNASQDWRTQILAQDEGLAVDIPGRSGWDDLVDGVRFNLHAQHSGVEVRRFSCSVDASLLFRDGRTVETVLRYVDSAAPFDAEAPLALGLAVDVDGLLLQVKPLLGKERRSGLTDDVMRSLRTEFFHHRVASSADLALLAGGFDRGWLHQLYGSALAAEALLGKCDVREAATKLRASGLSERLREALDVIFEALPTQDDQALVGALPASSSGGRGYDRLVALCASEDVLTALSAEASVLWSDPTPEFWAWAEERALATLGAAVLEAIQRLCPDLDAEGSLTVDLHPGPQDDTVAISREIWITETIPGGGGVLQRLLERYVEDPRRFFRLVDSALRPSDFELVDAELTRILEWASTDAAVADALSAVRKAQDQSSLQGAFSALMTVLANKGAFISHPVIAALSARILRPASGASTDRLVKDLLSRWRNEEARLGVEIDARVFAYASSGDRGLDAALADSGLTPPADGAAWRFGAIYSLLWPRGWAMRAQGLPLYNPFAATAPTDTSLLRELVRRTEPMVAIASAAESGAVTAGLVRDGVIVVEGGQADAPSLRRVILMSLATPCDVGYLQLYPRVAAVERYPDSIAVQLELGDAPQ